MIRVRVPATSANMGAGFDTLGIALGLYNYISVEETAQGVQIINKNAGGYIPDGENNLIYRAMQRVFREVGHARQGLKIIQNSQIPMTRGLGSSSACIIGGMLAANVLSGRKLEYADILDLAVEMEGHPDNAAPALYGGFCISAVTGGKTACKSIKVDSKMKYAVMVPDFFVATKKSRGTLPQRVPIKDAAFNISHAALFTAAMMTGDIGLLRTGVMDRLHQQYRKAYIEDMDTIFEKSYEFGAKATYLSGSGPTILSILDGGYQEFSNKMRQFFAGSAQAWSCRILPVDNIGAVVKSNI